MDEDLRQALRIELSRSNQEYWKWDECKWGTHRVNCLPGGCPFRVYSRDGRVIREEISCTYPNFSDSRFTVPDFNPRGCQKGQQHSRAMYGPDRVLHPMKRSGERGAGKWEPMSWEQAFAEIGDKLAGVIQKYGPQSLIDEHCSNGASVIRGGAEGTVGAITSLLGGVSYDTDALGCDFNRGQYLTFGQYHHTAGIEALFLPDTLFVLSNPVYANIPDMHYMLEARYRGAKVVVIAPDKNPTAQFGDMWLPVNSSADPALWLGVCRILIDRGWIDIEFIKEQTDLPVAVRADNGRFLRESDLRSGGDPEQFYAIDSGSGELAPLPKGTLQASCDYALEGRLSVTLADGASVELTTVFALLKRRLEDYTPDKVHEISGIHPVVLEQVAELCKPPRKVYVFINWLAGKTYHGDLIERSYCYMLALTGNVGKPGTGTQGWSGGAEFGCGMPMVSGLPKEILESADPILFAMNITGKLIEDYKMRFKMDPSMPLVEAAFGALREQLRANGTYATPIFLWYYHGGYKEVWDRYLEDPNSTKKISEYVEEALREGWWKGFDRPARDLTPRATFVSGGNPLRHYRGGMNTYLKTQWPRYELIVTIDPRWSVTALYSDYVLPAASYYEYADAKGGATSTRFGIFTDQSVPMVGESRSDRQIVLGVLRAVQDSFKKRGISKYKSGDREIDVDDLYWRATYGGHYGESNEDEERLVDHAYRALGQMGWYASLDGEEVSLDNARRNGMVWLAGRPDFPTVMAQSADLVPGEVFWPLRDQVERKIPYPTTTRRIEFYLDHPWFIEADEHLVRYKIPPFIGGRQPLRLTSGHVRWSIHGVWHTAEEMLKLHRGEPFAFINSSIAAERGIEDGDFIRVFNDYGEFVVRAKPTGCVRPDQLVIYHAWEPYQYKNGMSYDGLLPGPPKGIHFAGGYRHFEYSLMTWTPSQSDRHTNIQFERAELQA
jgi:steroid C-25 hydroxylase alpha subunit